ncbi:cerebellin-1-like [Engraulis encrasicolus]|uniref:cerebellin-1-like n=1 Tax=Engraulis encrasicolus TaxID=184585 RepID=UPI002FD4A633
MKSLGAAMILLWVGLVVVTAESVEIQPEHESLTQQICQPHIHTVLREMSAKIAEQQAELRHNKEQLQAVEKRADAMETGLSTQLQDVETRLRTSEKMVEDQKLVIKDLTEKQNEQSSAVGVVGGQVEVLRRDREGSRVSFSAALGNGTYGPLDVDIPLVFKGILTNIGNAYNVNTGVFTAPVRGVYHFVLFVFGDASSSTPTGASIYHNGKHVVIAYDAQVNKHHVSPANGASLPLEVGDVVQVKLWPKAWVRDNANGHTTFSGHLLFTL